MFKIVDTIKVLFVVACVLFAVDMAALILLESVLVFK